MNDTSDVGQGKTYTDAKKKYDAQHGTYNDAIPAIPVEQKIPQANLPRAPDKSPFKIGPIPGAK